MPHLKKTATRQLQDLYGGSKLLEINDRPVLWFESSEAYDELLYSMVNEQEPLMPSQVILVKDLADCEWEIKRLRRTKRAGVAVEAPAAAWDLMGSTFQHHAADFDLTPDFESLAQLVRKTARGDVQARKILESVMDEANVTHEMLVYRATTLALATLNGIEMAINRKERERQHLLRTLEDRRKATAAMSEDFFKRLPRATPPSTTLPQSSGEDDGE